ncbi:hypothetical protein [Roseibium limicola]|uniref:Uncharacterized protein n=1 Tax=Roseibium limicola TaxID=2816037 RepID=A0A939ENX7_9HYPH|nr:hypothetical protein [Roseibium limicola]MBO0345377.1 hypothetical protein [Roseibium limicola]
MSNFKAIMDLFGLSPEDAATYLKVDAADVVRWCEMHESPPIDVWQKMVQLFDTIRFAAEDAAKAADLDKLQATDLNGLSYRQDGVQTTPASPLDALAGPQRMIAAMATASLARVFV